MSWQQAAIDRRLHGDLFESFYEETLQGDTQYCDLMFDLAKEINRKGDTRILIDSLEARAFELASEAVGPSEASDAMFDAQEAVV